jgi:peptidoglycan/xylan/chitin deacetylase (PgdA/CDA1 family)
MTPPGPSPLPRRSFLAGAALALGAIVTGCGGDGGTTSGAAPSSTTSSGATTAPPAPTTTTPPVAAFVARGPASGDRVALTFHTNGDLGLADQLLDILAARHVRITSFIVGNWLDANPDMAKRIADGGHEFANHTYTHPTFGQLSHDAMLDEVVRCRDVLVRLTGGPGAAFRPSGTDDGTSSPGEAILAVAGEAGYHTVLGFDVDPLDYDDPGAAAVTERTLSAVHPGAIVSLHFGHSGTVAALPAILDGLDQRHLSPVTVSKLLG